MFELPEGIKKIILKFSFILFPARFTVYHDSRHSCIRSHINIYQRPVHQCGHTFFNAFELFTKPPAETNSMSFLWKSGTFFCPLMAFYIQTTLIFNTLPQANITTTIFSNIVLKVYNNDNHAFVYCLIKP